MNSSLFHIDLRDFAKGLALVVLITTLKAILVALQDHGIEPLLTKTFWVVLGNQDIQILAGYLLKNFLSTSDGKFLGAL